MLHCSHEGCKGTLVEQPESKGRRLVFKCSKCKCIFALTSVNYSNTCPQMKFIKPLKDMRDLIHKTEKRKRRAKKPENQEWKIPSDENGVQEEKETKEEPLQVISVNPKEDPDSLKRKRGRPRKNVEEN